MTIRSVLLHVDATPAAETRLEIAFRLAQRLQARLTAAFAAVWDDRSPFAYSAAAALEGEAVHGSANRDALQRLRRHRLAGDAGVAWCDIVGEAITPGFLAESIYADLLIVGQQGRVAEPGAAPPGFVEAAILQSGRPTLVVPTAFRHADVARCALVAWNGSLPSVRALSGALPLLRAAGHVHVASWARHAPAAPFSGIDIGEYLARHGVSAEIHRHAGSANVATALAATARDLSCDLIVMGCYGHSRAAERVFGGTSRSVLASSEVPVLMAH